MSQQSIDYNYLLGQEQDLVTIRVAESRENSYVEFQYSEANLQVDAALELAHAILEHFNVEWLNA